MSFFNFTINLECKLCLLKKSQQRYVLTRLQYVCMKPKPNQIILNEFISGQFVDLTFHEETSTTRSNILH